MAVKRIDSTDQNVSKYVFDFGNAVAEAVLYKYPTYEARTVICCSTQSGCPVGCRFCGAGDAFVRSLTADEIVGQVQHLFADRDIDPAKVEKCQIMFMSMGEPLLNFGHLADAIRQLHALYPRFSLLISTSAPAVDYERVNALSVEVPAVGLQFSVHESTDAARDALVPFKAKLNLHQIAAAGEAWFVATGRQPFFNYRAHEGNTVQADADRIYAMFDPDVWQATISVVCERDESVAAANVRQRQLATDFMGKLGAYGYSTRCFDPAGQDDIGGGCGQLWFVQDWMRNNPELARPSVGRTFPIVHAPREVESAA
ncbi:radical SAM protein [Duganella violaceipulchra]|uniref:23S rRNA (Adenine2503-C2)-methyltransferase n=1 Tax=Duganella violaceipulchra TaxID=2849652 RepID=A0AA41L280_9BURK|nr:radical SAM protein [Duganella violaceicalia]MBV6321958.1 radical SAM protein [Duganella violaceicalia]MCP2007047.1 23S rRNA (adenine2503-C2)-methyltransferase [Duganella violaceicalia]